MEQSFWQDRWESGRIGFHRDAAHPMLSEFGRDRLDALLASHSRPRVLVPLCGKSLDLIYLAGSGFDVVGVEFVESAIHDFGRENNLQLERLDKNSFQISGAQTGGGSITLLARDILKLDLPDSVDMVFDRAALVALNPSDRSSYVSVLLRHLGPAGAIALVALEHDGGSGPPFSVDEEEVRRLYQDHFAIEPLQRESGRERPESLRDAGLFDEVGYWLIRK